MTISVAGNIARCRCGTVPASHSRGAISRNASPSLCSTALRHASDATRRAKLRSAHAANAMKCADGSALAAPRRHRRALFCTPLRNRQAATVMSFYLSNTRTHVRKARRRNRRARHVDHLDAMRQRESPSGPLSRGDVERSKSTERKRHDDQKQHASTVIIARPPARQRAARAGPAPTKRIDDRPAPLRRRIARRAEQCAGLSGAHRHRCTGAGYARCANGYTRSSALQQTLYIGAGVRYHFFGVYYCNGTGNVFFALGRIPCYNNLI